jgi:hypothetical protein
MLQTNPMFVCTTRLAGGVNANKKNKNSRVWNLKKISTLNLGEANSSQTYSRKFFVGYCGSIQGCFGCVWDDWMIQIWVQLHITCPVWIHTNWYWWVAANTVHWIHQTGTKLSQSCHVLSVCEGQFQAVFGCVSGWMKDPNESSYTSHVMYGSIFTWYYI